MEKISHRAHVVAIEGNKITLEMIDYEKKCSACAISAFCNLKNAQKVEFNYKNTQNLKVGDDVVLNIDESAEKMSVILLFALPVLLIFTVLCLLKLCGFDDAFSAGCAVLAVGIYFLGLYLFKNRFNKLVKIVRENK